MALKTFGSLSFSEGDNQWELAKPPPHVCIKLKAVFPYIPRVGAAPFYFRHTPETCHDLLWFMERYPFEVSPDDLNTLMDGRNRQRATVESLEAILMPDYIAPDLELKAGFRARNYQMQAAEFDKRRRRWLLGDDIGLGKSLEAILTFANKDKLPGVVCCQTHLPKQWKEEIEKFTHYRVHIIKGAKPYNLPDADIYVTCYSRLAGWSDVFATGFFKSVAFDEAQELRRDGSDKYQAARVLSDNVEYCLAMTATPVYNYGDEMFNVLNLVNPGCLGDRVDFLREWAYPIGSHHGIKDPPALGAYLRDNYHFLRRTRADVGRELPQINKVVITVGYDAEEAKRSEQLARQLASQVLSGNFFERGQAARELDIFLRQQTGIAKAREVAAFVRLFLENGEPVVLAGWHRAVYEIWMAELKEFKPVLYTGSESIAAKDKAVQAFCSGETNLFIISLRSGIGLNGLQYRSRTVVFGEQDWSPQVHEQVIGRVDREGQAEQVSAYFCTCDYGSDPVIIDMLGLKASQAHGISNPTEAIRQQFSDESRIKILAESFLKAKN